VRRLAKEGAPKVVVAMLRAAGDDVALGVEVDAAASDLAVLAGFGVVLLRIAGCSPDALAVHGVGRRLPPPAHEERPEEVRPRTKPSAATRPRPGRASKQKRP
jgi:hypothetical protein